MLVICNGAIKSGSNWPHNILNHLVELERPRDVYRYRGKRFLRKGVIDDWRMHFDKAMIRNIEGIEFNGIDSSGWRSLRRRGTTQPVARRR